MKSLETQFNEAATVAKKHGIDITPFLTEGNTEQRLNRLKATMAEKGIKESTPARVRRNNGRSVEISESDAKATRISKYMKKAGCSLREATIILTGKDPGPGAKEPDAVIAERAASWKKFCPTLTETECQNLASRGIEP